MKRSVEFSIRRGRKKKINATPPGDLRRRQRHDCQKNIPRGEVHSLLRVRNPRPGPHFLPPLLLFLLLLLRLLLLLFFPSFLSFSYFFLFRLAPFFFLRPFRVLDPLLYNCLFDLSFNPFPLEGRNPCSRLLRLLFIIQVYYTPRLEKKKRSRRSIMFCYSIVLDEIGYIFSSFYSQVKRD